MLIECQSRFERTVLSAKTLPLPITISTKRKSNKYHHSGVAKAPIIPKFYLKCVSEDTLYVVAHFIMDIPTALYHTKRVRRVLVKIPGKFCAALVLSLTKSQCLSER